MKMSRPTVPSDGVYMSTDLLKSADKCKHTPLMEDG